MCITTATNAQDPAAKLLDLSTLADTIATRFANPRTHPKLWTLYRTNVYEALVDHMHNQPLPEVVRA